MSLAKMVYSLLSISILLLFFNILTNADDAQSNIDMTQPCIYPVPVGLEKMYIPDKNLWATSQINSKRGAIYGRLRNWRGGGAWTSSISDSNQHLGIDLGYRQVITGVATQGRRGSREWVIEYYLWYSNDNYTWRVYTDEFGSPLLLPGNTDDNTVVKFELPYQIIAQFIRINPQRWHRFISLRADLFGCRFDADDAQFDGQSRISYDLSGPGQYVQSRDDLLKLRFRTNTASGLLFFADGNQGDYMILELVYGRLYLNYNLGSTPQQSGDTTLRAGSLLDDNQWHDVLVTRSDRNITIKVDQMSLFNVSISDFIQLDLDRKIHIGGIDNFLQPGKRMLVRQNFTGCMENVWFNYMNIIQDSRMNVPRYQIYGKLFFGACQLDTVVPISIPFVDAYILVSEQEKVGRIRVTFDFRSYNPDGLLFFHSPSNEEKYLLKITPDGYLQYIIQTNSNPIVSNTIINVMADSGKFTDGLWHSVEMDIQSSTGNKVGSVTVIIDKNPDVSVRQLRFTTGPDFLIAGGDFSGGETGFIGCLRRVYIQGQQVLITDGPNKFIGKITTYGGVKNGSCALQDRCDPNPCEHLGTCSQDYNTFSCDCEDTGYTGAVCHRSTYMASCEEVKLLNPYEQNVIVKIDIDDSGPFLPFEVNCILQEKPNSMMELGHDSMAEIVVDGYPGPGSYMRPIEYVAQKEEIDAIIDRALKCEQAIRYACFQSRLLADAGNSDPNIPSWGWFVSKEMAVERYWGGSAPDSKKCACGLQRECKSSDGGVSTLGCNCDASIANDDVADEGTLYEKDRLPVKVLHFGDTGTIYDEKWGKHKLGPLKCEGDTMFQNTITFRIEDATISLPKYNGDTTGDIRFQIKTTAMEGIVFQNTGPNDHFIETRIVFGNVVQFRFNAGNGIQTLEVMTSYPVNDNEWHTIQVERNRKQSMLRVDQQKPAYLDEPTDQEFRKLDLTSSLVVGAAVDYSEGYVGCIRAFMVNGVLQDLKGIVESGQVTYGVAVDCVPKCASNPCYNGGICVEYYSRYWCDCGYTPFRGWNCGREVGVTMQPDYMLRYEFDKALGDITTIEENIYIGFSTQEKRGMLMFIRSDADANNPMKYILIEINNNGGIRVAIDVGIYRDELNTDRFIVPYVDLTNGQQHVVHVTRSNQGRTLQIAVDDYPVATKTWDVIRDGNTRFDNPRYIYFGRNESTPAGQGFKGCLFRAQWDNQYPIKRVFQDPRGNEIVAEPSDKIIEDMCGFIELSHKPDPAEFRNTPDFRVPTTTPYWGSVGGGGYSLGDQILIGVLVSVFLILLLGTAFLIRRYYYNTKRSYKTYEAKDAEYFDSPDFAITAAGNKQPEIVKTKEFFM